MDNIEAAIVNELRNRASLSPAAAQDAHAVREAIGCSSLQLDGALVRLSDMGVVGTIMSDLYLKQDAAPLMQMFETPEAGAPATAATASRASCKLEPTLSAGNIVEPRRLHYPDSREKPSYGTEDAG